MYANRFLDIHCLKSSKDATAPQVYRGKLFDGSMDEGGIPQTIRILL